uniref:Putative NOP5 family protein n=1 Tax=Candidatus Methanophaga sp. ANME-1 ERB7 TaxID=2759913 RepID=A0A7G9Z2G2_9EURY|nr:putative NOP5 family protein [Methanosarcinales archaeon ANME-1 ERB7]
MKENRGKREKFLKKSKRTVSEALRSRDMLLSGVTKTIDDLNKIINQLVERLEDWYGIYFPELKLEDHMKYAELVMMLDRGDMDKKELSKVVGQKKADEIASKAQKTLGTKLEPEDLAQCHSLARSILEMDKLRTGYEEYQKKLAEELCPNMSIVGGADIAAKLVSHIGSLNKLAMLPSSTIQVLGAEKALFKHLKNKKVRPPKHGLIFQHARIASSPKSVRGKIARALANKLSMAAKADAFTKRDISKKLKTEFDERYNEIMDNYRKAKEGKGKKE